MFKNYFTTAFRNIIRNKSFTVINVIGLAVGIASCLLIFLLTRYELSYDNFHSRRDRIYRIVSEIKNPDGIRYTAGVPFPVADGLRLDFPNLEKVADIFGVNAQISVSDDDGKSERKFKEENSVFYAEPEFFDIFNFPLLAGNKKTALNQPNTVVLSQSAAEKYFGNWKTAMGKIIKRDNKYIYKVTGILKNVPTNTDFPLQVVISYSSLKETDVSQNLNDWGSTLGSATTFVVLPPGLPPSKFNDDLDSFVNKHKPDEYAKDELIPQPFSEIHFDSRFGNYSDRTFSHELITALSLIALFLLIIACVNFINLATAQAVNRSREVGVRKVLGGSRGQLAFQFLSETALITILAVVIALAISEIVLPYLNDFLNSSIRFGFFSTIDIVTFLILIIVTVTFLSGFYPAMVLSGFNPIMALRNKITSGKTKGVNLRRGLVIFQFIIAQALIVSMLVLINQMDYFRNASLGFNKNAVVLVPVPTDSLSNEKLNSLKTQLLQQSQIKDVSYSIFSPADDSHWTSDFKFDNSTTRSDFSADLKWADADYFKTYDIKLIAGRFYNESDTIREFVVNETFVKKLGIKNPEDILGKKINFWKGEHVAPIVGVVKDFHTASFRKPISAAVMGSWKEVYELINIKIQPQGIKKTLATIEKLWSDTFPEYVYEYQFLDKKVEGFYKHEDQLSQLYKIFAGIAIFISCLGLYGLVSFMAVRRTKEVGIRKVLGASAINIIFLFAKEFALLIGIAFLAAAPISYFIMQKWLEDFAFRIEPGVGIFIATIAGSLILALITVSYKSIRAALANPVKSLKYE